MTPHATTSVPPERQNLSIHGMQSLAAAVPYFLGFHPQQSLVMLCLTGPHKQLGASLRIGLPVGTSAEESISRHFVHQATRHATGVVLLCYSDEPDETLRGRPAFPRTSLVRRCMAELIVSGMPVLEVLFVRDRRVWSYLIHDPRVDGFVLPDADAADLTRLGSAQAVAGRAVLPSRAEVVASIAGPVGIAAAHATEQIEEAAARFATTIADLSYQQSVALGCRIADQRLTACWTAHQAGRTTKSRALADLIAVMSEANIRDTVISWGIQRIADEPLPMVIAIARWTPDELAGPICLALAIIAYRNGDGALANVALDRVLAVEPGNRLAGIMLDTFSSGVHPAALDRLVLDWSDHPANPAAPLWDLGSVTDPDHADPSAGGDPNGQRA